LKYPSTTTGRMAIAPEMNGQNKGNNNQLAGSEQAQKEELPPPNTDCCS
jgi:hypothetical protein